MGLIIVGIIWVLGFSWFAWEIKHAPIVPKELEDLF